MSTRDADQCHKLWSTNFAAHVVESVLTENGACFLQERRFLARWEGMTNCEKHGNSMQLVARMPCGLSVPYIFDVTECHTERAVRDWIAAVTFGASRV